MTTAQQLGDRTDEVPWYSLSVAEAVSRLAVDPAVGLEGEEVGRRLVELGPNELPSEPAPSIWAVAGAQLANPMNVMLVVVAVASILIGQISTGVVVGPLVLLNVVMGTNQELKAKASVEALAELQVLEARVRRSGSTVEIDATGLVPGDIVQLEAGEEALYASIRQVLDAAEHDPEVKRAPVVVAVEATLAAAG